MWNGGRFGRRGCGASLLLALMAATSEAASLKLPDAPYAYTVIDQDLPAALQEFGSSLGIKVNVSAEVKGRIQGRLPETTPRAFLDRLCAQYNLEWYYDGSILYVSSAREVRTQLLVLSPIGFERFRAALDSLDLSDPRYPLRPAPGRGLILASGPPRYVALVEQTLAGLVAEEQARPRPVAEAPRPAPPPKVTSLTVFRGSQMTVFQDGRPERLIGPEPEPASATTEPAARRAARPPGGSTPVSDR